MNYNRLVQFNCIVDPFDQLGYGLKFYKVYYARLYFIFVHFCWSECSAYEAVDRVAAVAFVQFPAVIHRGSLGENPRLRWNQLSGQQLFSSRANLWPLSEIVTPVVARLMLEKKKTGCNVIIYTHEAWLCEKNKENPHRHTNTST